MSLFRETLLKAESTLEERFHAGRAATELVQQKSAVVDQLLIRIWQHCFKDYLDEIALVAVGGYGRGELHPASDVDILILLKKHHKKYQPVIEQFLTFLWDIGLEIGHSVRTVKECVNEARQDITIATNIQEARLIHGPPSLFDEQRKKCGPDKLWPGPEFFAAKWKEQQQRHQKFNDTAYNLEPNIKEGPGGLRDIQVIGWIAKRHFDADTLEQLVDHGFLTAQEYQTLHQGQAFLWRIRFGLHILTGRREDRLLFDHQRALAKQFGFKDNYRRLGVEQFMKQYYRTITELSRLNEMLLQLFQEEILYTDDDTAPVEINSRFQSSKGFLEVSHEKTFEYNPFALLEVFLLLQQHPDLKGIRANTIRAIREHLHLIDAGFRNDIRCKSLFMEILRHGTGVTHVLRRMNTYGVLAAYIPSFAKIVGQMQHDLFHVYTVDEHTLFVIRNLRRFTVAEHYDEFPLCSRIINNLPKQELVLLAGLFHDIAKGRGGDHSVLGEQDAREFCQLHELSVYDTNLVGWLVRNHLLMSSTAQRKDISDPMIVHEFAQQVGNKTRLDYLYLLTVADIRGTSSEVWNNWKDALLRELYFATHQAFRRGLDHPLAHNEYIEDVKQESLKKIAEARLDIEQVKQLWSRLGDEYFLRYNANEILWHTREILSHTDSQQPLVLVRDEPQRGGSVVFIYTQGKNNIFTIITSTLNQLGLTVYDARVLTSTDNYTLDSFILLDHENNPVTPSRYEEIKQRLTDNINNSQINLPPGTEQLTRQAKHFTFATRIHFQEDKNNHYTIMEVITYDRPGLLARIGTVLNKCQVQLINAKIATFGERAEDIFILTDEDGNPVATSIQQQCLEPQLIEVLNNQ
ncbi:MAG: [protein-PII] uridylyltransferase [Thioalkalispiraceae bacterium]